MPGRKALAAVNGPHRAARLKRSCFAIASRRRRDDLPRHLRGAGNGVGSVDPGSCDPGLQTPAPSAPQTCGSIVPQGGSDLRVAMSVAGWNPLPPWHTDRGVEPAPTLGRAAGRPPAPPAGRRKWGWLRGPRVVRPGATNLGTFGAADVQGASRGGAARGRPTARTAYCGSRHRVGVRSGIPLSVGATSASRCPVAGWNPRPPWLTDRGVEPAPTLGRAVPRMWE